MVNNCGNCQFFRRAAPNQPLGVCRARPPVPMLVGMLKHPVTQEPVPRNDSFWPQVPDTEWCGAHQERPRMSKNAPEIDLGKLDITELEGRG